jgi:hypothetical protein
MLAFTPKTSDRRPYEGSAQLVITSNNAGRIEGRKKERIGILNVNVMI